VGHDSIVDTAPKWVRIQPALTVWHGAKVLGVLWADDGAFEEVTFLRDPEKMKHWSCGNATLPAEQLE
jgi:hypothetical protein